MRKQLPQYVKVFRKKVIGPKIKPFPRAGALNCLKVAEGQAGSVSYRFGCVPQVPQALREAPAVPVIHGALERSGDYKCALHWTQIRGLSWGDLRI